MAFITPPLLTDGSVVALVSPSSSVDPDLIHGAELRLRSEGFEVRVMPGAAGKCGSFASDAKTRLADLQAAIDDLSVNAIICTRGGYGAVHLLQSLNVHRPIWLAGFSDISALHALWHSRGFRSVHSSMAKELALGRCKNDDANRRLMEILRTGVMRPIEFAPHPANKCGHTRGTLIGGNLAVLDGLAGTPFDMLRPDSILVVEDVAEPIYKVERMFYRLRLAGVLGKLRGLVVGQFNAYKPSEDYADMYEMLAQFTPDIHGPVAFGAPIGHINDNLPFIEGAEYELSAGPALTKINQIQ